MLNSDGYQLKDVDANKLANNAAKADKKLEDQEMLQTSDLAKNEYLITANVQVTNGGLSAMQQPFDVAIVNPNLELVSSNSKSAKLF